MRKSAALWMLAVGATAYAQQPTAAALAKKVDAHYNHLHSLATRYTERYQGMGMDRTETGTLTLQKPGRMRWAYDSPPGKLFVLDGTNAISYTPGDAEATRFPEKRLDDLRSPLRFLLGHTQLKKELDNLTVAPLGAGFRVSGVPRGMSQRLKLLTLDVNSAGAIERMRLEEVDGAVTEFEFSGMQENVPIKNDDFVFTPPAGVTVVDGLPPI